MTSLRVLVVEDEWPARNYLVELLEQSQCAEVVAAVAKTSEAEQALAPGAGAAIDVAFVDVRLSVGKGDQSGLEWIRTAARAAGAPMFVLATAYPQHALEAFDLGVVDYLVKPFTPTRVSECVARLVERRRPADPSAGALPLRVAARRDRVIVFLGIDEVWACEAADRLTFVHSTRGRFDLDLTLSAIAASFGKTLLRVHRNWLVNPARVVELERDAGETTLLVGSVTGQETSGVRVPVAKDRASAIRDALLATTRGIRHP
jgi:DNA-binding LytR/AlgR family response regulator